MLDIELMEEPVTDHTFLPAAAEKLCTGYDLYWSSAKMRVAGSNGSKFYAI